ncbi:HD domain-containing phosphohydrolase [Cellulosilyticum sp. I15G10I2]|uniref:HD domain-containing phosphohydrolase n=1 Tax=Cellulosilyticum sp. I15G10I2 TaxID=1892843 RepID=UPI00085C920C|nr:HD domain-containing phosphohydrolase [Cellulosilyticum sp. I15G10I2]
MKIGYKTFIIAAVSTLLVVLLTYFVFHISYFGYINTNQEQQIKRSFEVIDHMLYNERDILRSTLIDWAYWDDTYDFINTNNTQYIDSNLDHSTLEALKLRMMIFLNTKGDIVHNINLNLQSDVVHSITNKLLYQEKSLQKIQSNTDIHSTKLGILLVKDQTFLVGISPITDSSRQALTNGYLIMVREIDEKLLGYIRNVTGVSLKFESYNTTSFKNHEKLNTLLPTLDDHRSKTFLEATRIITDLNGESNILLTVKKEHKNYENIYYYFKLFISGFLFIVLLVGIINIFIIHKYILKRLLKINDFLNTVAKTKDTSLVLSMSGNDEFYELADSTNKMLAQLDTAYKSIQQMNERFRIIMEATNDGYLDYFIHKNEIYMSQEWKLLFGYDGSNPHELFRIYASKIHPECYPRVDDSYLSVISGVCDYFNCEYRIMTHSGQVIWVLQRGKVVEKDEQGLPIRLVSTLTNITDRKTHEEEVLFLSYSDKLTGLKNRAYMEEQFEALDLNKTTHYFIIMGDLNGLKLTNDALGHKEGDRLLGIVSKVLLEVCSRDDIVSRWGGDEFVILVKDNDKKYTSNLISKIREACENISDFHFKISMALGYAEKSSENSDTEAVMNLAEKRMYRNKLMENKSARSATINSLSRTLHEKHSETEEHTMRIRNLSLQLGKRLQLSQDKLDELELLALLHDIGKIGIPDHILLKPSKLTDEEWYIMKTHTEIGYRIAQSTPELSHIASGILAHHERFDGTGYPNGLKGQEIPVSARIINVVDAFDVMTHQRAYKQAFNKDYAIKEILKCSGTQFDPLIASEFISMLKANTSNAR